jgi:5-methyltetrahydropteroyltriglutamate--homocysteine methyltransferase
MSSRILTTHVGSLIRPPALVAFLKAKLADQPYDHAAYAACLGQSVRDVVKRQIETGLDIVNDGEFGKAHWVRYVAERLSGVEARVVAGRTPAVFAGRDRERFPEFYAEYDKTLAYARAYDFVVTGPIAYKGAAFIERDIANLKAALKGSKVAGGFLPVVAPASLLPELKDEHYGDTEKLAFAVADALAEEYRAIVKAGLIAQVDDAWLPAMYDRMVPPAKPAEYRRWAGMCVAALNHALRGLPEAQTRYHICWGSWNGPHTADLPLAKIADLLVKVRVGGYSVEAANPRHEHEWKVWKDVKLPAGRQLLPGVISHATNIVEHPELVAERLVRFAGVVGRESVIGSTDCGFAQGALYQRVHPSIMWAKLGSLVEGARIASKELWAKKAARPAKAAKTKKKAA